MSYLRSPGYWPYPGVDPLGVCIHNKGPFRVSFGGWVFVFVGRGSKTRGGKGRFKNGEIGEMGAGGRKTEVGILAVDTQVF